jgi:hypothetical protein
MKEIKKIQEFFSKPIDENNNKNNYEVVWSDRDYKEHSKFFKNNPQGASDNAKIKAQAFMKSLEDKDKKNPYGLYRSINLKSMNESQEEYFKPSIRKDKSNPNFLYITIPYPIGSSSSMALGSRTMSGKDREEGAIKALSIGNTIAKKLESKYNIKDIEVKDLKNGKVQVFAVSDDFIKLTSPSLDEAKKETGIDMAKKQLDALGVKYEISKTDKVRPFKVIYKPINKSDKWYDEFEDIVDLFNLKGFVKTSMNEASGFKSGKEFINIKLQRYPKAVGKVNQLINMIGEPNFTMEMAEWIWDFFNNASFESPVYEASKEEETKFHKKLDKLVHNTFGKRKDELEESLVKKIISSIREAKSTPCWKGYEQKGMKEKNGKQVPNCVPKK